MASTWGDCVKGLDGLPQEQGVATLECLPRIFSQLINWAFILAGVVALFFILYAGVKLVNSGGDKAAVDEAKKTLTFAIIGLVIVLFSSFFVKILAYITGVDCITAFGFSACPI